MSAPREPPPPVPGRRGGARPVDARRPRHGAAAGLDDDAGRLPVPQGRAPGAGPAAGAARRGARRAAPRSRRPGRRRRPFDGWADVLDGRRRRRRRGAAGEARRAWWRSAIRCTRRASRTTCASSTCRRSPCRACSSAATRIPFGTPDELEHWTATIAGPVTHHWIAGGRHDLRGKDGEVVAVVKDWLADLAGLSSPSDGGGRDLGGQGVPSACPLVLARAGTPRWPPAAATRR